MNLIEFIIIYLACGAPFSVYFYLENRFENEQNFLWLKTFLAFVFWIPFSFLAVRKSEMFKRLFIPNFNKISFVEVKVEENLYSVQKEIEKIFTEKNLKISLFEFRQTIERYVGLTFSVRSENAAASEQEKEIFRVAQIKDVEIAALCLKRRNRKLLDFHHTKARQDFLQMIERLFDSISDVVNFQHSVIEFVNLLNDSAARDHLEKLFAENLQTESPQCVQQLEKVLWKSDIPEPMFTEPISARLQILTAATSLRRKD